MEKNAKKAEKQQRPKFYVRGLWRKIDTKEDSHVEWLEKELERAKKDISDFCDKFAPHKDVFCDRDFRYVFWGEYLCVTTTIEFARKHRKQIAAECFEKELTVE